MPASNAPQPSANKPNPKAVVNPAISFLGTQPLSQETIEQLTQDMLSRMGKEKTENAATIKQILTQMLEQTGTMSQKLKITPGQLEGIYNIGYQCYNQTNYKKAIGIFRLLFLLNPLETKYIFSLGLSLEKDKQFYPASTAYLLNTFLDEANPIPTFRTAICFLEMGESLVAETMFQKTVEQCKDKTGMEALAQRASLFLAGLKKPAVQEASATSAVNPTKK